MSSRKESNRWPRMQFTPPERSEKVFLTLQNYFWVWFAECSSHSPSVIREGVFRRSKITFGYGLACRLWRLRTQARSVSSRKESKQYFGGPECSSHSPNDLKRCFRRSKITVLHGAAVLQVVYKSRLQLPSHRTAVRAARRTHATCSWFLD